MVVKRVCLCVEGRGCIVDVLGGSGRMCGDGGLGFVGLFGGFCFGVFVELFVGFGLGFSFFFLKGAVLG